MIVSNEQCHCAFLHQGHQNWLLSPCADVCFWNMSAHQFIHEPQTCYHIIQTPQKDFVLENVVKVNIILNNKVVYVNAVGLLVI